jgi:hypothetical protein
VIIHGCVSNSVLCSEPSSIDICDTDTNENTVSGRSLFGGKQTMFHVDITRGFKLPQRCKWDTRFSGILRGADGLFVGDVSTQLTGPVIKGQAVEEEWPLKMAKIVCPNPSLTNYQYKPCEIPAKRWGCPTNFVLKTGYIFGYKKGVSVVANCWGGFYTVVPCDRD